MRNTQFIIAACLVLALGACSNHSDDVAITETETTEAPSQYLVYVQKMIAATNDDGEPWDVDAVAVEQDDGKEATEIN